MSRQYPFLFFVLLYVAVAVLLLNDYIPYHSLHGLLGMATLLLTLQVRPAQRGKSRYAVAALLFAILCYWLPVKTVAYAALICAAFFATESFAGRLPFLPLLALAFTSPVFDYAVNIFSFPIRLQLTAVVARLLTAAGVPATVEGNTLLCNGSEFSVDPACMGLHMLAASFLTGLMLVAIYQKKYRQRLPLKLLAALLVLIFICNLVCNLFRMLCLVYFTLLPESPMHDVAGLVCFALYVLLPACWLSHSLVLRFGKKEVAPATVVIPRWLLLRNCIVAVIVIFSVAGNAGRSLLHAMPPPVPAKAGYSVTQLPGAVTKLQNQQVLVYLKQIAGFYATEHHPMICWKGSGYEFRKVQVQQTKQYAVYTAVLEKNGEQLYTAWWYSNGTHKTISQMDWRWDLLRGAKDYSLINVTAATKADLDKELLKAIDY
jgi:exosortase N